MYSFLIEDIIFECYNPTTATSFHLTLDIRARTRANIIIQSNNVNNVIQPTLGMNPIHASHGNTINTLLNQASFLIKNQKNDERVGRDKPRPSLIVFCIAQGSPSHHNVYASTPQQPSVLKYQALTNQVCGVCVRESTCGCLLRALWRMQPGFLRRADQQMRLRGFTAPHNSPLSICPQGERTLRIGTVAVLVQGEGLWHRHGLV